MWQYYKTVHFPYHCAPVLIFSVLEHRFFAASFISSLVVFPFMSGGDKDESEDPTGDLRRTESDSVLKKVSISAANYS